MMRDLFSCNVNVAYGNIIVSVVTFGLSHRRAREVGAVLSCVFLRCKVAIHIELRSSSLMSFCYVVSTATKLTMYVAVEVSEIPPSVRRREVMASIRSYGQGWSCP